MTTEEHIQQRVMKLEHDVEAMRKSNTTPNPNSIFSRYGNAIVDYEGRIAELKWVLSVMKRNKDEQPQLNKGSVLSCKELLFKMANEQLKLMQPDMAEVQIKEAFKNLQASATVKKMIEERQAL